MRSLLLWVLAAAGLMGCPTCPVGSKGPFRLTRTHDSLYHLNEWVLPYPVFQFQTGDVDADGSVDALVGVVKSTRFHHEVERRLFLFKMVRGKVRPLWLGSRLGGRLVDFRFADGRIRALESSGDTLYAVSDYRWQGFGPQFERFVVGPTDSSTAFKHFTP